MALLEREQIGLRYVGTSAKVPNDPKAKLMYYLNCVKTVLDIEDIPRRLTAYATNYNRLSDDDIAELLAHCMVLSPDLLKGKCFFENNSQTGSSNKFLELSAVKSTMLIAGNVAIGGQNKRVAKIMTYTRGWMRCYYEEPMVAALALRLQSNSRPAIQASSRPAIQAAPRSNGSSNTRQNDHSDGCCIIL